MNNNRIESLDSLRGIAAMAVVIFHCLISYQLFYAANYNGDYNNGLMKVFVESPLHSLWAGKEAVLLFFVLSGFVLAIPFLNNRIGSYRDYAIKRFFRIYIPYILVMLVSVLSVTLFAEFKSAEGLSSVYENRWDHDVSVLAIISYILMLNYDTANVNGVVWTLFHEMRISLIFPIFMFIIAKYKWKSSLLLAMGLSTAVMVLLKVASSLIGIEIISKTLNNFGDTFYYSLFFIAGAVLSKYRNEISTRLKPSSKLFKFILFLAALLLINYKWMLNFIDFEKTVLSDFVPGIGILLLFVVVLSSNLANNILTTKPLLWLGKISYSLYLTHIVVIMMMTTFLSRIMPLELTFILSPIVALPVAYFSHKYFEMPAIGWGKNTIHFINQKFRKKSNESERVNVYTKH